MAAVVPESLVDTLRAAEADAAMDELGESIPWEQVKAELRQVKRHGVAAYAIDIRPRAAARSVAPIKHRRPASRFTKHGY